MRGSTMKRLPAALLIALLGSAGFAGAAWADPANGDGKDVQDIQKEAQDEQKDASDWQKFAHDIERSTQEELERAQQEAQSEVERHQLSQQDLQRMTEKAQQQAERAQRQARQAQEQARQAQEQAQRKADEFLQSHQQDLQKLQDLAKTEAMVAMADIGKASREWKQEADSDSDGGGDTSINERRPLNPGGEVYVNEVAGSLVVTAWSRSDVQITGDLASSAEHLEITGDANRLSVVVKQPQHSHGGGEADLRLMVPANARVSLETVSADVTLQGTHGAVRVNTVSGDVGVVSDAPQIDAQSVSGDLILQGNSGKTHVTTVSGDLRLTGMQGELSAESVSGNLELRGGKFSSLRAKSVSGDMTLDLSFAQQAMVVGETLSGNITLHVPPGLSGTALLKSFSGDTQCDMQPVTVSGASHSGKKKEYTFGDGKGVNLQLSTFSGDIRLDRGGELPVVPRPPAPPALPALPALPAPPG
jgi:DUF4097 and DUF4098 domain-containing protein YvlB